MKKILQLITGLFFVAVMAVTATFVMGVSLTYTGPIVLGLAVVQSAVMPFMAPGVNLFAGVLKELWTGELINKFRHEGTFMARIPNANQYVNNDVIHLADIGADPDVLINNNTYPIASVQRTDSDVTISLDKFDTVNTKITDDELYALPYDKEGSVLRQHREALEETTIEKSLHAMAPLANVANSPVIATTGASNGESNPRLRLIPADLISMKRKFDDLGIPKRDRLLVLCNQHVQDLLLADENFSKQYLNKNIESGRIGNVYGFETYEENYNPVYTSATDNKVAYGAAANPATDQNASVAFYTGRSVKATGTVKMYKRDSSEDPENRETTVGFRMYHIAFPKTAKGFGAIYSDLTT